MVYEGRGWNTEGAHTCGFNKDSYAICFIGNFVDELPDKLALKGTYIYNIARNQCIVEALEGF